MHGIDNELSELGLDDDLELDDDFSSDLADDHDMLVILDQYDQEETAEDEAEAEDELEDDSFGLWKGRERRIRRRYRRKAQRVQNCTDRLIGRMKRRKKGVDPLVAAAFPDLAYTAPFSALAAAQAEIDPQLLSGKSWKIGKHIRPRSLRRLARRCDQRYRRLQRKWAKLLRLGANTSGLSSPKQIVDRMGKRLNALPKTRAMKVTEKQALIRLRSRSPGRRHAYHAAINRAVSREPDFRYRSRAAQNQPGFTRVQQMVQRKHAHYKQMGLQVRQLAGTGNTAAAKQILHKMNQLWGTLKIRTGLTPPKVYAQALVARAAAPAAGQYVRPTVPGYRRRPFRSKRAYVPPLRPEQAAAAQAAAAQPPPRVRRPQPGRRTAPRMRPGTPRPDQARRAYMQARQRYAAAVKGQQKKSAELYAAKMKQLWPTIANKQGLRPPGPLLARFPIPTGSSAYYGQADPLDMSALTPSVMDAMKAHPLEALAVVAASYAVGAIVGKKATQKGLKGLASKGARLTSAAAGKTAELLKERQGSSYSW